MRRLLAGVAVPLAAFGAAEAYAATRPLNACRRRDVHARELAARRFGREIRIAPAIARKPTGVCCAPLRAEGRRPLARLRREVGDAPK